MQPALELGDNLSYRSGGTGGGGNDVQGGGSRPAQVTMEHVKQSLVIGIGMNSGHQPLADAKALVQYLDHRGNAVGGAGGVGYDFVLIWLVLVFIYPEDDSYILVACRG